MEIEDLISRLSLSDGHLRNLLDSGLSREEASLTTLMRQLRELRESLHRLDADGVTEKLRDVEALSHDLVTAKGNLQALEASLSIQSQPAPASTYPVSQGPGQHDHLSHDSGTNFTDVETSNMMDDNGGPESAVCTEYEDTSGTDDLRQALREWRQTVDMIFAKVTDARELLLGRRRELAICHGFQGMRV